MDISLYSIFIILLSFLHKFTLIDLFFSEAIFINLAYLYYIYSHPIFLLYKKLVVE